MLQGQKRYGESSDTMAAKLNWFKLMLADYDIDQIQSAFIQYAKTKDDIPAPANIIQLIENPLIASYDDVVCTCGQHYGKGCNTPEKRAKSYAWHRDNGINYIGDEKQVWLDSYEREHGAVQWSKS